MAQQGNRRLAEIEFRNDLVDGTPGDDSGRLDPRQTPGVLYSRAEPTRVKDPKLIAWSNELAAELGLSRPVDKEDIEILAGNRVTPSMKPYAACYAGHQFGNWAGQLGDGRAITLGEYLAPDGRRWELQLKGAGPTAYSRRADGRAVLRSSVREYLMSEAMHHLRVPTTRALALVGTGEKVLRDMFYDGNAAYEPGAIVMRVAPSFLRFGNYEMPAARKEITNLRMLVDRTINDHFPGVAGEDRILDWFREVSDRTAFLMSEWMRVGFVHGVMNTDNMSILGLTIDYGPYSFLDEYDLNFTPNTTDLPGRRYAFGRQASIAQWNLGCLAGAISPLLPDTEGLLKVLEGYRDDLMAHYRRMMRGKIGLADEREEDARLITRFEQVLATLRPDMTIFYQLLIELPDAVRDDDAIIAHFSPAAYAAFDDAQGRMLIDLIRAYLDRVGNDPQQREHARGIMRHHDPRVILRNYQLHEAIEALEQGDDGLFRKLEAAMLTPYSHDHDELMAKRPDWAASKAGCSMLSCSS